ncbi:MAG: 1-deoxy-D-xylulose-5-phosphate synthase [Malacoplasma sp.]
MKDYNLDKLKQMSNNELISLANEVRLKIINLSKEKNIHLASNLGIIELTIALLFSFNLPIDKLIYDTGHQTYAHKILTGRWDRFETIRDDNGLSGFPDNIESEYDVVGFGHSGTSLSFCQGLIESNDNHSNFLIPIIGDASISNGISFEALNNISFNQTKMIIVLNDNGMSISKNVGAFHKMLSQFKISSFFLQGYKIVNRLFNKKGFSKKIYTFLYKMYSFSENVFLSKNLFQNLDFIYIGPIDGHNIKQMIKAINSAKYFSQTKAVVLHVKTKKGFGLEQAVNDDIGYYHSSIMPDDTLLTYGRCSANWLEKLIESKTKNIKVLNCGMTLPTGFWNFSKNYPKQYEDVGIAEEHAVAKSIGISYSGDRVYVVLYSTFLQRSYDQIHDISRLKLPVCFLIDRGGISYGDGDSHHGIYDISFIKSIPNSIICNPSNKFELEQLLEHSLSNENSPFFIRYTNDECLEIKTQPFIFGSWLEVVSNGNKKLIISYGNSINEIKKEIKNKNIDLINSIYITHYDTKKVIQYLKKYKEIYVIEKCYYENNLYTDLVKIIYENKITTNIFSYCIKTNKIGFGTKSRIDGNLNIDIKKIISDITK